MADAADIASEYLEEELDMLIRQTAAEPEPGYPGECDICGEHSGRLVRGVCAPCRDKYKLD